MFRSSLQKLHHAFPPPQYLTMPALGLDISDEAVKVVELKMTKQGIRLGQYASYPITKGIIESGVIRYPERLVEVLKEVQVVHNISFVYASLPDEHAYLFQTEIERGESSKEIRTAIEFKLKENVPLAPEEVVFDYDIITPDSTKKKQLATVSVYPREVAETYLLVMNETGITPISLETESEATARSVVDWQSSETIMVIDMGKAGSELSIVSGGERVFATSLDISGDSFTHALERFFQCSYAEAEQMKKERGFIKSVENEEVFEVLIAPVSNLRDELNTQLAYWHMHRGVQQAESNEVVKIVLTGGGANLKGLCQYFTATMSVPIERSDIWVNILDLEGYIPPMSYRESLSYATAAGLALRAFC